MLTVNWINAVQHWLYSGCQKFASVTILWTIFRQIPLMRFNPPLSNPAFPCKITVIFQVNGIKALSSFIMVPKFDLAVGFPVDWMHCVLLGVSKSLLKFWISSKYHKEKFYLGNKVRSCYYKYAFFKKNNIYINKF